VRNKNILNTKMGQTCCKNTSTSLEDKEIPKDLNCKEVKFFVPKVVCGKDIKVYDGYTIPMTIYQGWVQ
jgi:hypothetical protein